MLTEFVYPCGKTADGDEVICRVHAGVEMGLSPQQFNSEVVRYNISTLDWKEVAARRVNCNEELT
jgi:hypothetical protein